MMPETTLSSALYSVLYYSAIFVVPPLIVATVVAFVIGLFQAVTQIQEQTLPQTVKIFAIGLMMLFFGSTLAAPFYSISNDLFTNFATYGQR